MAKSKFVPSKNMQEVIETAAKEALNAGQRFSIPCPFCGKMIEAHLGDNTCPSCDKSFVAGTEPYRE